jgi:hypothetical protein
MEIIIISYALTMPVLLWTGLHWLGKVNDLRECLAKCVQFVISKNAWISSIDYLGDQEITMEEALEFLKECKE